MTVERIIKLLEIEKECVLRNACGECNRACHICELVQDDTELHEMYAEVIALLKAQEPEALDMPKPDSDVGCWYDITHNYTLAQVVSALKAQEPRVMDFDDVVGGDECWLEAVNGACGYADCYACTGTGEVQVFSCNFDNPQYIMASDYLKTWRCWTSRPTDAQREKEPWNG